MSDAILVENIPQGMITLRGDLASTAVQKAVKSATGTGIPSQRQVLASSECSVLWMSPDELLVLVPYDKADAKTAHLQKSLNTHHHLAVNVSDARTLFRIRGRNGREVLAKGAPVDLAPGRFEPGMIRRTRIGLLAAAFWMPEPDTFHIICFRSVAAHMEDWLRNAARLGSLPGVFAT